MKKIFCDVCGNEVEAPVNARNSVDLRLVYKHGSHDVKAQIIIQYRRDTENEIEMDQPDFCLDCIKAAVADL